jgi:uncharacterized OB-fold protein
MSGAPSVVCTKCGFVNAPGDQFCGSCGAFLEWEGSVVGDTSSVVAPTASPVTPPATPAGAPASAQGTPTTPPATPAAAPPDAGLLRCPSCGVANAANRTFCQSCGTKLAAASRVAPRTRDEIAAAVAAVPGRTTTAPGLPPVPRADPASGSRGSRRLPLWIVAVVILGVLAGVGAVVLPALLKGSGPTTAASDAPSAAGSGGAAVAASGPSSAPGASDSGTSASATPTLPASAALHLISASASTTLGNNTANYGPGNVIDGSVKTSWQEGSPTEKGQWIEVGFDPATVTAVVIRNGYDKSTALFKGNLRLKDVKISIDGGKAISVRLKDTQSAQQIDLPATPGATRLRITIVSTYASVKTSVSGTPFDDAAVSEISVLGVAGG